VLVKANYPTSSPAMRCRQARHRPGRQAAVAKLKGFLSDGVRAQLRDMVVADPSR
jgi:phosphate transport system permease protein